ncbi:hypothetical protein BY458DRAFT_446493 [Sporodiniella umbellata]|nr:hypothetical protein BY458DRAFT_446493 [Sporodiniella umbellata]
MKDLYSFDQTKEDAFQTYEDVTKAYRNIFGRLGVPFLIAEADSGNIGGSKSHEYHLVSTVGEDTLLTCDGCGYTANEELAVGKLSSTSNSKQFIDLNTLTSTFKNKLGIKQTLFDTKFVSFQETSSSKTQLRGYAAVLTPSGRPANLLKVQARLGKYLKSTQQLDELAVLEMKEVETQNASFETPNSSLHVFLDDSISLSEPSAPSSLTIHPSDHFRIAREGDNCASCNYSLTSIRAIECGHTFYLGTKYSSILNCGYRKSDGQRVFAEMGCYGIGITRLLAAIADAKQDERGIVWPKNLAPYSACIVPTDDRNDEFKKISDQLYDQLNKLFKNNVVIDNRRSGFGAKMKDAELVGYPYVFVVGQKSLTEEKIIELHERIQGKESAKTKVSLDALESFFSRDVVLS